MAIPSTALSLQNMRCRGVKDSVAINEGGIHLESLSYRLSIRRTSFHIGKSVVVLTLITPREVIKIQVGAGPFGCLFQTRFRMQEIGVMD